MLILRCGLQRSCEVVFGLSRLLFRERDRAGDLMIPNAIPLCRWQKIQHAGRHFNLTKTKSSSRQRKLFRRTRGLELDDSLAPANRVRASAVLRHFGERAATGEIVGIKLQEAPRDQNRIPIIAVRYELRGLIYEVR